MRPCIASPTGHSALLGCARRHSPVSRTSRNPHLTVCARALASSASSSSSARQDGGESAQQNGGGATTPANAAHEFDVDSKSRTIETAVGSMPLSPIMDPVFWEAKRRHKKMKPDAGRPQNSLERQFRSNPFARALATPIRQCTLSKVRVPSFFLQDFNLIQHPKTKQPWWVPRSLTRDEDEVSAPGETKTTSARSTAAEDLLSDTVAVLEKQFELQQGEDQGADLTDPFGNPLVSKNDADDYNEGKDNNADADGGNTAATDDAPTRSNAQVPNGPRAYILARRDLFRAIVQPKSGYMHGDKRLLGASSSRYRARAKAVWRVDMDTVALDLMRRDIAADLLYLARLCAEKERYYIVRCFGWGDVKFKHKGSILWFSGDGEGVHDDAAATETAEPGPYATYDMDGVTAKGDEKRESLVVHNIPRLLGSEHAERLRKEAKPFSDGGGLFMLAGRRTVDVQEKLWKLQGYLADYRGEPEWTSV